MKNNKGLNIMGEIIIKNKLCISQNPKGITKYWPKSYVCKFYYKLLKSHIFDKEIINFLDIDSKNKNQIKLWKLIFKNLNLTQTKISEFDFKLRKSSNNYNNDFDIIVMNKIPTNHEIDITRNILNQLNKKGLLILEDCGERINYVLKIFIIFSYKYDVSIEDYRLHRMLRNNCLLIIKNYESNLFENIITFNKNFLKLLYFMILEAILKVHDTIIIVINN